MRLELGEVRIVMANVEHHLEDAVAHVGVVPELVLFRSDVLVKRFHGFAVQGIWTEMG